MKVLVALEQRFRKTHQGGYYADGVYNYAFFARYLKVFDEVCVFARVSEGNVSETESCRADGPGVRFIDAPHFIGPVEYLKNRKAVRESAVNALKLTDAFVLRVPGTMGTLVWKELQKRRIPYGVEVVGDPWDSLAPGSVKSSIRPFLRILSRYELFQQCRHAAVASYVTEHCLQRRYPPGGWSTDYSSVELSPEAVVGDSDVAKRLLTIEKKKESGGVWRICYAGTMSQLYKAPDILIEAVADCINKGLRLQLVMLGDGQFRSQLELQVKKLGIEDKITFLGHVSGGKAVYEQFSKSDLYVLPSRQEGLPRSVIEAMARGLPCIGSTVGGFKELLPEEFLVKPAEVKELSKKIKEVVCNPEKMKQAVIRNIVVAKKYTSDTLNKKRVSFYTRLRDISQQK